MPTKRARCEMCLKLFPENTIKESWNGDMLCPGDFKIRAPFAPKTKQPKKPYTGRNPITPEDHARFEVKPSNKSARCEKCFQMKFAANMIPDMSLCLKCAEPGRLWFAIAVYGSDTKARTAIKKRAKIDGVEVRIGRIIIPRAQTSRVTKDSFEVKGEGDKVLGFVTAHSHDDAWKQAREKYEVKTMKGVYKPDQEEDLATIEKGKQGRRVCYIAKSASGKVLGKVTDSKRSRAEETLKRLYGPKDVGMKNPYGTTIVTSVTLKKEGGVKKVKNERAMPGYILIQCDDDPVVFKSIKTAAGVGQILPFYNAMTYEDVEDSEEEGYALPSPSSIETDVIEQFIEPREKKVILDLKPGDTVQIVDGTFVGTTGKVVRVTGLQQDPDVTVEIVILGQKTEVTVTNSYVRK